MEKQILLPVKVKREMMHTFNVGRTRLGAALKYESNSPRAKMLRAAAIQRGGMIYTGQMVPKAQSQSTDTVKDREVSVRLIGGKVQLKIDIETSTVRLLVDGVEAFVEARVPIQEWSKTLCTALQQINEMVFNN
ncbi:MAG: hypothetical protein K2N86_00600 [Rikenellaceae bacterium]|nr:hypothetical protein [Rikenellaceae bacterium]MDE7355850.1 hypothetical protein [Rikenellaceae bacterium]